MLDKCNCRPNPAKDMVEELEDRVSGRNRVENGSVVPAILSQPQQADINTGRTAEYDAIAQWQATAGGRPHWQADWRLSSPPNMMARTKSKHRPTSRFKWDSDERVVLLNINNERVDPPPENIASEVIESMLDRIEVRKFCVYHHLLGICMSYSNGKVCKFVHGPKLDSEELRFLRSYVRRVPCETGSKCRRMDCMYGHSCQDQSQCGGDNCSRRRFHGIDSTSVKVWRSF